MLDVNSLNVLVHILTEIGAIIRIVNILTLIMRFKGIFPSKDKNFYFRFDSLLSIALLR